MDYREDPELGFTPFTIGMKLCDDDGIVRRGAMHDGVDYTCTSHAHFAGEHIRCTSPAHAVREIPVTQLEATASGELIVMSCSACGKPWRMNAADARPQTVCECGGRTAVGYVTFTSDGPSYTVPAALTNGWQTWTAP